MGKLSGGDVVRTARDGEVGGDVGRQDEEGRGRRRALRRARECGRARNGAGTPRAPGIWRANVVSRYDGSRASSVALLTMIRARAVRSFEASPRWMVSRTNEVTLDRHFERRGAATPGRWDCHDLGGRATAAARVG
jgi:hypothetical protein